MSRLNKILPFGEWHKVYERAGKDFHRTQAILESNFSKLFEGFLPQTGVTLPEKIRTDKHNTNTADGIDNFGDALEITQDGDQVLYETAIRIVDSIPGLSVEYGGTIKQTLKDSDFKLQVFKLIIAGIGNSVGVENLATELKNDPKLVASLKLKSELAKTIYTFGKDGLMYCDTKVSSNGGTLQSASNLNLVKPMLVLGRFNTQNLVNWVSGTFEQYVDLSARVGGGGAGETFQYGTVSGGENFFPKYDSSALYLYSTTLDSGSSSSQETTSASTSTKGASIPWREMDFDYDEDGDIVNEDTDEIRSLIKQIVSEIKPNEIITKLQLTSTINPKWYGITTEGSGTGEPVGKDNIKLTAETFKNDKTSLGNQWLAWKRGVSVADELYQAFGSKIQKNAIEVMWKIGQTSATIPNITYSIVSKTTSPSDIPNTKDINNALGQQAQNPNATLPLYLYKITFDGSALAKAIPGKIKKVIGIGASYVAFEDVKPGQSIKYKGKTDGVIDEKLVKKGKVLSVGDGKITLESESGNKITISKDRFISAEKAKEGAYVE